MNHALTTPAGQDLNPNVVAQSTEVLATHGRSFRLASHFLPKSSRQDAAVVYAFCRLVDDLADEADDAASALRDLNQVRDELHGRTESRPLLGAFRSVLDRCSIDVRAADHLIDAVLSDLEEVRVEDDEEFLRYCYGVAGTVGLMMCGVLGVTDSRAHAHAIDLGVGMQITNICRDVKEDAAMGRVYLPATRLKSAGTSQEALINGTADPESVAEVVRGLLDLAEDYYKSATQGLHYIPFRPRGAIVIASRVYRAIGLRLLRLHQGNALIGRTVVPKFERFIWVIRGAIGSFSPTVLGWRSFSHDPQLHTLLRTLPGTHSIDKLPVSETP
jgi:phytoene synthase